ncbi:FAD-binding protein [Candidatus Pelagibacter ubique]|nr:FAD-binding protein [Candidatus Pelagibacter ubique]
MDETITRIDLMSIEEIRKFSNEISSKINFDYDLKKSNWFNIGGQTKVYFRPDNLSDLILFLKKFGEKEKIHILGAGSNTLISDEKFDGVVIKLGKNFSNISILPNDVIIAGSACLDKKLSDFALNNGIGGFEFLACIPGTIGGGLKMNAGCFNKEFKDVLVSIQAIDKNGQVFTIPASKVIFKYRSNDLKEDLIFLSASFKGTKKNKEEIENEVLELKKKKDKAQPTKLKTSGSTFKNPIDQTDKKVWVTINNAA